MQARASTWCSEQGRPAGQLSLQVNASTPPPDHIIIILCHHIIISSSYCHIIITCWANVSSSKRLNSFAWTAHHHHIMVILCHHITVKSSSCHHLIIITCYEVVSSRTLFRLKSSTRDSQSVKQPMIEYINHPT